jgi:hypothetical protein
MSTKSHNSIFNMPLRFYPIGILDYVYVSTWYITLALITGAIINGILLPPFDDKKSEKEHTAKLVLILAAILSMQGFVVCAITTILDLIPSPINGLFGYNTLSPIGVIVRNPAIMSIIIFTSNETIIGIIKILLERAKQNSKIV